MDIWGRCGICEHWFACPVREAAADAWSCPVCAGEPVLIVNRAVSSRVVADRPLVQTR